MEGDGKICERFPLIMISTPIKFYIQVQGPLKQHPAHSFSPTCTFKYNGEKTAATTEFQVLI